jgi:PleD family two-component response regulator
MFVHVTEASSSGQPSEMTSKGRVLVADDELALVRAYSRTLASQGYEVKTARMASRPASCWSKGASTRSSPTCRCPG